MSGFTKINYWFIENLCTKNLLQRVIQDIDSLPLHSHVYYRSKGVYIPI